MLRQLLTDRTEQEDFLSRLGNVATVQISSKHPLLPHVNTLNYSASKAPYTSTGTPRSHASTTFYVSRLFWNLPVRRQALKPSAAWEALRHVVLHAALAYPHLALTLNDLDAVEGQHCCVLSTRASQSLPEKLLGLFGGSSVDLAATAAPLYLAHGSEQSIRVALHIVKDAPQSARMQFVTINGTPVVIEWLSNAVARDLSARATPKFAGPIKMGSPRFHPVFLLQIECDESQVELLEGSDVWFDALFGDREALLASVGQVVAQLGVKPSNSAVFNSAGKRRRSNDSFSAPKPKTIAIHSSPLLPALSPVLSLSASRMSQPHSRKSSSSSRVSISEVLSQWASPCFKYSADRPVLLPSSSDTERIQLTNADLAQIRIVGQMDCRVILAVIGANILVAFDQHAVDERVRLEQYLKESISSTPELCALGEVMQLSSSNSDACLRLAVQMRPWFRVSPNTAGSGIVVDESAIVFGTQLTAADMLEFARDLNDGSKSEMRPKAVQRVAAYRACRGAIKFGDFLSNDECLRLVQGLYGCNHPFICAHGRQNVVPLYIL